MADESDRIRITLNGRQISVVPLDRAVMTIGSAPDSAIALRHPAVARQHAELRIEASGVTLTDLGSTTGTRIADTPLLPHQPQVLADGATLQIGPFVLTYQMAGAGSSPDQPASVNIPPESDTEMHAHDVPETRPPACAPPFQRTSTPAPCAGGLSRYLRYLPNVFGDSIESEGEKAFLNRYLLIFESIWEPYEQRQNFIDMFFDPRTCPPSFVPLLANWLGLPSALLLPESRLRDLLGEAMELYHWRGTHDGLTRMIRLCTGLTPEIGDDPDQPFVLRITVRIPTGSLIGRDLIENLVQAHKPAHIGYVLETPLIE